MITEAIIAVEKEDIPSLNFPSEAVQRTEKQIKLLKHTLSRSMILGNIHRVKMRITFEDDECVKQVRTTIWAVGDKNIVLKKGVIIPICRVIDIM